MTKRFCKHFYYIDTMIADSKLQFLYQTETTTCLLVEYLAENLHKFSKKLSKNFTNYFIYL